ncbi:MAG: hypothetical protein O7G87_17120 [bacterium]|nr:hypothetical protein [bacterium]
MRYVLLLCLSLLAFPIRADAMSIKVGGGALFDPVRWGGHLSIELPLGDTYPTYLAPYVEFYSKDQINEIPIGATLLYKAPFSDLVGTVFFGVGGGVLLARSPTLTIPGIGTFKISETQGIISAGGGLRIDIQERIGIFAQARWFKAFAPGSKNQVSVHIGLHFDVGGQD